MKRPRWTQCDLDTLRYFFGQEPTDDTADRLDRTVDAVRKKASSLGIRRKRQDWTDRHRALVIRWYGVKTAKQLAAMTGRTPAAVYHLVRRHQMQAHR